MAWSPVTTSVAIYRHPLKRSSGNTMVHQRPTGHRNLKTGHHAPPTYLVTLQVNNQWVRQCLDGLAEKFGLSCHEHHDPHITLVGPFTLPHGCDSEKLFSDCLRFAGSFPSYTALLGDPLLLRGRRGYAAVIRVTPDSHLSSLAARIRDCLLPHARSCTWFDKLPGKRVFHVSIGFGLRRGQAREILDFLEKFPPGARDAKGIVRIPGRTVEAFRIAVIRNGALWRVFDVSRNTWIGRSGAFRQDLADQTLEAFRKRRGYELDRPSFLKGNTAFVISDLHLGHANIIPYTSRPFPDVGAMDKVLIHNWNLRVKPTDTVYFLGDLAHGRGLDPVLHHLSLLSGVIHFVAGNHDTGPGHAAEVMEISWRGHRFMMVHDPNDAPLEYPGFVIHGHMHNNQPREYPFLNMVNRRVNVSAEVIGYVPMPLDELVEIIECSPEDAQYTTVGDARRALHRDLPSNHP